MNPRRPSKGSKEFIGRWRIEEMDLWDRDALDLVAPFIEFRSDMTGKFGFIAVEGWMDCREAALDDRPGLEFSWDGNDECDPASGRGWAVFSRTDLSRDTSTFTWATTRHFGPSGSDRGCLQADALGQARRPPIEPANVVSS